MFGFFKKTVWPPNFQTPPWGDRKSIYEHVAEHIDPDRSVGLSEVGSRLPDEPEFDNKSISFAPGAMDGMFGHHGSPSSEDELVSDLHSALVLACKSASARNINALYNLIKENSTLGVIDPLLERIYRERALDAGRLRDIAIWFATKAADREPVKFSLALLGALHGSDDSEVLLTLGRHDEFTLYCAVAILSNELYSEEVLWKLAKGAEGWGRISTVERLTNTANPRIKDWLLRDGFKNSVMYEYLACICARSGELHLALKQEEIDTELFNSATELIDTLISGEGGPAEGLSDYEHGCSAIGSLLVHSDGRFSTASDYWFLWRLKERVSEHLSGERQIEQDWSAAGASAIAKKIDELLSERDWRDVIKDALINGDQSTFWAASRVCKELGIDPWPYFFERTKNGEGYWWDLMRTTDAKRIDDTLALALEVIPLEKIATGPETVLGLGIEYELHNAIDFILQDLGRFPGKGWAFVEAGLQSPVMRNRNMALNTLSAWPRKIWPVGAEAKLRKFKEAEPDADIKSRFEDLIASRSPD